MFVVCKQQQQQPETIYTRKKIKVENFLNSNKTTTTTILDSMNYIVNFFFGSGNAS